MELIVTLLVALPLGFAVRNRTAAFVAYVALHGFVFTYQTLSLLLEWIGGGSSAFGPYPKFEESELVAYGLVNLVIFAVGLGLVEVGHRLRLRRTRSAQVDLDVPAAARG